ncbi:hypothetical protein [Streptomyces qinglanensis]|uniref:hypothetical protein n=1 Tax=Streptomyces qinglanensis TaxID=943816 RepID=UPI003790D76D
MSSGHKTVAGFCTVLLSLVLVITGLAMRWPAWGWGTAAALLAVAVAVVPRLTAPAVDPLSAEFTTEPDRPTDPPERREQRVTDAVLPSAAEDYDFRFSATVRWCPQEAPKGSAPFSPSGVAIGAVLERAREITETCRPQRSSLAQHRLVGELAVMLPDPGGRLLVMAEEVTLTLTEPDTARLRKLSTVRKDEALWSHERRYEQDRRDYLGKDVLQDTGTAVVWWLAKNEDQIHKAVGDLGVLAQLSAAANDRDVPERYAHWVPAQPEGHQAHGPAPDGDAPHSNHPLEVPGAVGPGTPPVNAFERLLDALGVPAGHEDAGVLARALHEGAVQVGREGAIESVRQRFDPATVEVPGLDTAPEVQEEGSGQQGRPGS